MLIFLLLLLSVIVALKRHRLLLLLRLLGSASDYWRSRRRRCHNVVDMPAVPRRRSPYPSPPASARWRLRCLLLRSVSINPRLRQGARGVLCVCTALVNAICGFVSISATLPLLLLLFLLRFLPFWRRLLATCHVYIYVYIHTRVSMGLIYVCIFYPCACPLRPCVAWTGLVHMGSHSICIKNPWEIDFFVRLFLVLRLFFVFVRRLRLLQLNKNYLDALAIWEFSEQIPRYAMCRLGGGGSGDTRMDMDGIASGICTCLRFVRAR